MSNYRYERSDMNKYEELIVRLHKAEFDDVCTGLLDQAADALTELCEQFKTSRECFEALSGQYEHSCASGIKDRKTIEQLQDRITELTAERDALAKQLNMPIGKVEVD